MKKIWIFLSIVLVQVIVPALSLAQTFSERSKAAYEAMTPSQRREISDQIGSGKQITILPQAQTRSGSGSDSLLFLKGLNCSEWNDTVQPVRKNWLNQFMDSTKSKDYNPVESNHSVALVMTDEYCQRNPFNSVELAFSATFRKFEADSIIRQEAHQKRASQSALERNAEMDAKAANRQAESRVENQRVWDILMGNQSGFFSCADWSKLDVRMRLRWVKQYQNQKVTNSQNIDPEAQEIRLQRFCLSYPDIQASVAHSYIYGVSSTEIIKNNALNPSESEIDSQPAKISWRRALQNGGAEFTNIKIDGVMLENSKTQTLISPGFHTIQYMCRWANNQARSEVIDIYVKSNLEYSMSIVTHAKDMLSKINKLDADVNYSMKSVQATDNFCSASTYECNGYTYISKNSRVISCLKEKFRFLDFRSNDFWLVFN